MIFLTIVLAAGADSGNAPAGSTAPGPAPPCRRTSVTGPPPAGATIA